MRTPKNQMAVLAELADLLCFDDFGGNVSVGFQ